MAFSTQIKYSPKQVVPAFSVLGLLALSFIFATNWPQIKDLLLNSCYMFFGEDNCSGNIKKLGSAYVWTLLYLPIALIAELLIRAKKDQPIISVGFIHDFGWWLLLVPYSLFILAPFIVFLTFLSDTYVPFLRLDTISELPVIAQVIIVLLAADFLMWFSHMVRHKVPFFWKFHALHHSSEQLNFFTYVRVHPVDMLFAALIRFVPFTFLTLDVAIPSYFALELLKGASARLVHTNARTNLGPLRYIFVTPQSHRIHHSPVKQHHDLNYGVIFTFWDFMFGTQWKGWDDYPDTGIKEASYPFERSKSPKKILVTIWKQFWDPFFRKSPDF